MLVFTESLVSNIEKLQYSLSVSTTLRDSMFAVRVRVHSFTKMTNVMQRSTPVPADETSRHYV